MTEEWKIIDEFPQYSVSSVGRVMNNNRNYILIGGYDRNGYRQVTICDNGKQYNRRICRLVAKAFIPNPNSLPCINHIDENKKNDSVDNLEWCTVEYNNNYGNKNKTTSKFVRCIQTGKVYKSTREAERQTGIYHSYISYSARHNKIIGGYSWEYI